MRHEEKSELREKLEDAGKELAAARQELAEIRRRVDSACEALAEEDAAYIRSMLWPTATDGPRCECGEAAEWVRHTQFAGDHYFCGTHARQEKNFGQSDPSYFVWEKLEPAA